jgi:hypothetical protein
MPSMQGRPIALLVAVLLNAVIGLSGLSVAATLASAAFGGASLPAGTGLETVAGSIAAGFGAYSIGALIGAVGLLRRSRAGWVIALIVDLAGLAALITLLAAVGLDAVLLTGLPVWGAAVACLVAPSTRRAVAG